MERVAAKSVTTAWNLHRMKTALPMKSGCQAAGTPVLTHAQLISGSVFTFRPSEACITVMPFDGGRVQIEEIHGRLQLVFSGVKRLKMGMHHFKEPHQARFNDTGPHQHMHYGSSQG